MKVRDSDLRLPLSHGVRAVALGLLHDAVEASGRLDAAGDVEALHDFRVAVRRLRSWLRAFDDELAPSLRAKDRRRLRRVADATSPGRDLEVQLAWVARAREHESLRRRQAAAWLARWLALRQEAARAAVTRSVAEDFPRVREALVEGLAHHAHAKRADGGDEPTLGAAIAARLVPHAEAIGAALARVHAVAGAVPAHEARIEGKRLRYLLEPVAQARMGRRILAASRTLGRLVRLTDALGTLHDAQVMANELRHILERVAVADVRRRLAEVLGVAADAPRDGHDDAQPETDAQATLLTEVPSGGLLSLAGVVRGDMVRAFSVVERHWLDGRDAGFGRDVAALARRLHAEYER